MKASAEKKKEILLDSFETLKKDFMTNGYTLADIIIKMSKIDIDTAIEMWVFLLKKYPNVVKSDDSYTLTGHIIYDISKKIGEETIGEIVLSNSFLKKNIFSLSSDDYCLEIIKSKILNNDLNLANELLELFNLNTYKKVSWYSIIDTIIPEGEEISEEAFELLTDWINKIKDKGERAKLNVKMLGFAVDDEE